MIKLRLVAALGALAVLFAGYGAYVAYGRSASTFVGATDPAHVAAANNLMVRIPAPAGMTLDRYGTGCDWAGRVCFTGKAVQPETAFAAMNAALVAHGGRVRSHQCGGHDLVPHGCDAVVDYQGAGIEVMAGTPLPRPGNAHTTLRLTITGVDSPQPSASAPYGSWASVDPLPAAWTTAVTCLQSVPGGCARYSQRSSDSPVISVTFAEACALVRRAIEGRYYLINDGDYPASNGNPASCGLFAHRYRTVGGKDGETLSVHVSPVDARHVTVAINLSTT